MHSLDLIVRLSLVERVIKSNIRNVSTIRKDERQHSVLLISGKERNDVEAVNKSVTF